jgi:hypothetical protein
VAHCESVQQPERELAGVMATGYLKAMLEEKLK